MTDVLETADQLFTGALDPAQHHPFNQFGELAEISPTTAFVAAFANASAFRTDAGLVVVDTSSPFLCEKVHETLRTWSHDRLDTAVFTHGHIDHCFGVELYEAEAEAEGWRRPAVVAHEAITARFDRYVETAGYNGIINQRQFRTAEPFWPTEYRYPDETYRARLDLDVGGETLRAPSRARRDRRPHLGLGPGAQGAVHRRPLHLGVAQLRQPAEGAALRDRVGPSAPRDGRARTRGPAARARAADRRRRARAQALTETAALLEYLHVETIRMMNEGARLDDIVHAVTAPTNLLAQPYLRPDLRRARVRGAQRLAPLRRLVRRQPRAPQARARGRARG